MPEAYGSVIGAQAHENIREEDDEYDAAIKEKKLHEELHKEQIEEAEDAKEIEI